jgi:TetR/AcrR family transcriptional regulator, cholesterol catabolism regulator
MIKFMAELELGRREKAKIANEERIRKAASRLFRKQGFEKTTIRQIAKAADLGLGTVYNYVDDKHGLLDMISKDDIDRVTREAFESLPAKAPVLDSLLHVFRALYAHYQRQPDLALIIVKEMTFAKDDKRKPRVSRYEDFNQRISIIFELAQKRGELGEHFHAQEAAALLYGSYFFQLIVWLSGSMTHDQAIEAFRRSLHLHLQGLRRHR